MNAFDGAAERLGLHGRNGFPRQDRIQREAQPLDVDAGYIHVVVDGAVIAKDAGSVNHVAFGSDLCVEAVGDDVIRILIYRETKSRRAWRARALLLPLPIDSRSRK